MAFDQDDESVDDRDDAIEDADDEETDSDEDSDESDDSDDKDEDESEDDEDNDESDSDDDDNKPVTRKELKEFLAKRKKDRDATSRRISKKGKDNRPTRRDNDQQTNSRLAALEREAEKRQVGHELGLTPGETDVVYRMTGNKKPTAKTLKDPVVKGALEGYRTAQSRLKNTPKSKPRTIQLGSKDFNKLPASERKSHFKDRRREILESKK